MTRCCMSTATQDPILGDISRQILLACDILAKDFHRYQVTFSQTSHHLVFY